MPETAWFMTLDDVVKLIASQNRTARADGALIALQGWSHRGERQCLLCLRNAGPKPEGFVLAYASDPERPCDVRPVCAFCIDDNAPASLRRRVTDAY
jgi:hypothetical protein